MGTDLSVDLVGYGRPATEALARRIVEAKAGGHPLDPVTVVVPSNTAGLSARRLLATGDPVGGLAAVNLANVSFVTPFRLAELFGAAAMGDRKPLTNPVLAAAVRSVLSTAPGCSKRWRWRSSATAGQRRRPWPVGSRRPRRQAIRSTR